MATGRYEFVQADYVKRIFATPNDTDFCEQWGLDNTGANPTIDGPGLAGADIHAARPPGMPARTPPSAVVAVVDTGARLTHTRLGRQPLAQSFGKPGRLHQRSLRDRRHHWQRHAGRRQWPRHPCLGHHRRRRQQRNGGFGRGLDGPADGAESRRQRRPQHHRERSRLPGFRAVASRRGDQCELRRTPVRAVGVHRHRGAAGRGHHSRGGRGQQQRGQQASPRPIRPATFWTTLSRSAAPTTATTRFIFFRVTVRVWWISFAPGYQVVSTYYNSDTDITTLSEHLDVGTLCHRLRSPCSRPSIPATPTAS